MGAAGFLPKAIHSEGLIACIEMAISQRKSSRPASKRPAALGISPQPAIRATSGLSGTEEPSGHLKLGTI